MAAGLQDYYHLTFNSFATDPYHYDLWTYLLAYVVTQQSSQPIKNR
ncbi:hypothetical protein [Entomomonas asaccharolytica]|uniref:Uncharacterized protein n=1 Tax=Entomomonas asaccharolytica TaxID=2785331 RepID=A0A974RXY5_9GAMM|nr:hypothetical protein [Entomomonas asaccharolytica]QQP85369.1 hypothetical protein JHT90_13465 [Entomomonas asaccharolytica]